MLNKVVLLLSNHLHACYSCKRLSYIQRKNQKILYMRIMTNICWYRVGSTCYMRYFINAKQHEFVDVALFDDTREVISLQKNLCVRFLRLRCIRFVVYQCVFLCLPHADVCRCVFVLVCYFAFYFSTVKTLLKFTSLYHFIVLNLSFYRCKLPNLSFFSSIVLLSHRFIALSFFGIEA